MNNFFHKNIIGGVNITALGSYAYSSNQNYFTDNIILGVKGAYGYTALEIDATYSTVRIPRLSYYVTGKSSTYVTHRTNSEVNTNFINAYSTYIFPVIDNNDPNFLCYHVAVTGYTLPTKHYVDRLLELKDALLYRGTLTPSNTSGTNPGTFQPTGTTSSEAGAMAFAYTSAGSVYKVTNNGYFGNIHVRPGDMIISYSDSATTSSITGWNVVEMHITHTNVSGKKLNLESNAINRVLTNVVMDNTGTLTYTYTHLVEKQISDAEETDITAKNRQYVSFIDVLHDETNNNINIAYHTRVLKFNTVSKQAASIDLAYDSSYRFITNIHQDIDGHLSYSYALVESHEHKTNPLGEAVYDPTIEGAANKHIINEVFLDKDGTLYYTFRDATITTDDISHSGDKDISNTDTAGSGLAVITGINMTPDGQLSYNWSYVYDPHNDHSNTGTAGTDITFGDSTATNTTKVITDVNLSNDGKLTYTYLTLSESKSHHGINTGQYYADQDKDISYTSSYTYGMRVLTGINITAAGTISYAYSYVYNPHNDHSGSKNANSYTTLTGDNVTVISGVSLNSYGVLSGSTKTLKHGNAGSNTGTFGNETKSPGFSGTFNIPRLTVNAHGHVTSVSNQTITMPTQSHHGINTGQYYSSTSQDITATDVNSGMRVLTGINITAGGTISYAYGIVHTGGADARYVNITGDTMTGSLTAPAFYATSDINKKNILSYDVNITLKDIADAPIIKFTWKDSEDKSCQIGSIAQYWQNVLPESVTYNSNLSLNYGTVGTISGIINAREIIELKEDNKKSKEEINNLKEEINNLKDKINKIMNIIDVQL